MTAATQSTRGGSSARVEPTDLQFQHGYSMAEEWVRYTAEPAEVRRLKQFTRELSLNGESPAVFVDVELRRAEAQAGGDRRPVRARPPFPG